MNDTSSSTTYELTIPTESSNERLDVVLSKLMPDFSRTQIQEALQAGSILINGKIVKGKVKVKGGEAVQAIMHAREPETWEAEAIPLTIIYEDDHLLVINKPAGLVVHPGTGNAKHTMLNALLHYCPRQNLLPRAGILHRLDKDTTGLLLVAKSEKALKVLSQALKQRTIKREYQTIVYGSMISGGKVDAPIDRHYSQRKKMAVSDLGKPALTHYRIMEKFPQHTHLLVKLETGRTHQIRVHMAHIHHSIVGDQTYSRVKLAKNMAEDVIVALRGCKRQMLHAFAIELNHPDTDEVMRWEINLPEDFQTLLSILQADKKRAL